ncbi:MAG: hypothetical protein HUU02_16960, partial [Bacteroidetes bacterium]|nr:hypothetical protein [Bacteroidota bacterium]
MRTLSISILLTILLLSSAAAQPITWQNVTANYSLPAGISVFAGTRAAPALKIWYLDVDLNNTKLAVRPYVAGTSQTLPGFTAAVGAYAAVNGGYFGG